MSSKDFHNLSDLDERVILVPTPSVNFYKSVYNFQTQPTNGEMDSFTLDLKFESSSSSRARVVFFLQELARLPSPACRLPPAGARVIPFVQALGPRLQALAPFVQALGPDPRCPVRPPLRPLGCCRARPAWPPLCPLGSHPRPAWSSPPQIGPRRAHPT